MYASCRDLLWSHDLRNTTTGLEFVCFLLGNSPASEFYMHRFRTLCLFHLHRQVGTKNLFVLTHLCRWNRQSVPKRWRIKFRWRGITQKKANNIQNTAKVWNQEDMNYSSLDLLLWVHMRTLIKFPTFCVTERFITVFTRIHPVYSSMSNMMSVSCVAAILLFSIFIKKLLAWF